jgi:hypothetical protein
MNPKIERKKLELREIMNLPMKMMMNLLVVEPDYLPDLEVFYF